MRRSSKFESILVGGLQCELDSCFETRVKEHNEFICEVYEEIFLETCRKVNAAIEAVSPSAEDDHVEEGQLEPEEKGEAEMGELQGGDGSAKEELVIREVPFELQSIATPMPDLEEDGGSGTPVARSKRTTIIDASFDFGDRFRSMSSGIVGYKPLGSPKFWGWAKDADQGQEEDLEEMEEPRVEAEKVDGLTEVEKVHDQVESADQAADQVEFEDGGSDHADRTVDEEDLKDDAASIVAEDKPAGPEIQQVEVTNTVDEDIRMDIDTVEEDPVADKEPERKAEGKNVTTAVQSFIGCIKQPQPHTIASGNHKTEIPALKKAALAREREIKRQEEKKKRKEQRTRWIQTQLPVKVAEKPDAPPQGIKRGVVAQPSPSKKQRIEDTRSHKKVVKQSARKPETTPTQTKKSDSPQYSLTPAGQLAVDESRTMRKERRKEKFIPLWARQMTLESSYINLIEVFGTPNSMVVKNAAERLERYENRRRSSTEWTDEDKD